MTVTVELCASYRYRGADDAGTTCPASLKPNQNFAVFEYAGTSQAPPPAVVQCGERRKRLLWLPAACCTSHATEMAMACRTRALPRILLAASLHPAPSRHRRAANGASPPRCSRRRARQAM